MLLEIVWNVSPEIIEGWRTPNKYGLLFVTGLIIGYYLISRIYKKENMTDNQLDKLLLFMVIATVVGARLGHVFFYDWAYYKNHLAEIPQVWKGGLASHGGAIAIFIALWIYSKKVAHKPLLWILDRIVPSIAIAACFIRLGNLMNSEIVGIPTNLPWAFSFTHYYNEQLGDFDPTPRHPAQLYESISYLILFVLLFWMYWKTSAKEKAGLMFGVFLTFMFGMRFLIEFIKEGQTARDFQDAINTGQMLSIPFILIGLFLIIRALRKKDTIEN
ncbi:MAG: prolipoprotein diacylglyceryl transferase [Crocinitomicaceae bacterium]